MPSALMRVALELARRSVASGGGPFGAVVARGDEVVGRGANRVVPLADPTAHAEIQAIRDAARRLGTHELAGCTLVTSCEPCPMCLGAAYWARLEAVCYAATRADAAAAGFDDARIYRELGRPWGERELPSTQEGREEAREVFRLWLARPDRVPY